MDTTDVGSGLKLIEVVQVDFADEEPVLELHRIDLLSNHPSYFLHAWREPSGALVHPDVLKINDFHKIFERYLVNTEPQSVFASIEVVKL